jgi:hypothetical protein
MAENDEEVVDTPPADISDSGWINSGTSMKRDLDGDHAPQEVWDEYLLSVLRERPIGETWRVTLTRRTATIER